MCMNKCMNPKDIELFEKITGLTQEGLFKTMELFLSGKYDTVISTEDYIIAEGNIPIALAAHLDTVFTVPSNEIFYDRVKNVMWSPDGLGADDRAGVFAIIQLIRQGLRPHIILTTEEEVGGLGAKALIKDFPNNPFKDLRYIIQLDRRGSNDCVFYACANDAFTEYVSNFGFTENYGTFTDISTICPAWKIAGVNLSVGYTDEHSISELFHVNWFFSTLKKVAKMLREEEIPAFEYVHSPYYSRYGYYGGWYNDDYVCDVKTSTKCGCCGNDFFEYEMMPVKRKNGIGHDMYCIDCAVATANWCDVCHEAFIGDGPDDHYCPDCVEEYFGGKK